MTLSSRSFTTTFERLSMIHLRGTDVKLLWLTNTLWAFLCQQMTKEFTRNLRCLVAGEEHNGLELWKVRFHQNQGGSKKVQVGERRALHIFPECPDPNNILQHVGRRKMVATTQG